MLKVVVVGSRSVCLQDGKRSVGACLKFELLG